MVRPTPDAFPEIPMTRLIRVAHSPDSDDAFMFYALAKGLLETGDLRFEHVLSDIESLNRAAVEGRYEVTAISIHAYAHLADRYALLPHGASMGDGYGPVLVSREPLAPEDAHRVRIAIPGEWTSAALALRLWNPRVETTVVPFDEILPGVLEGRLEAGVLIHEGQLTYEAEGAHRVVDLGVWWQEETDLPLPLGGNAIRRDLGPETIREVSRCLRESIAHALRHREEALGHAMGYARGLDPAMADRFVGMYVNDLTLDYGERGRRALREFLGRAAAAGLIPGPVEVEFTA
jgi:1,4-dihydroxy-6-naphthoate synthase